MKKEDEKSNKIVAENSDNTNITDNTEETKERKQRKIIVILAVLLALSAAGLAARYISAASCRHACVDRNTGQLSG